MAQQWQAEHVGGGRPARYTVLAGACALAVGMGVGRFGYTPILPLMHAQAGLSTTLGAGLATANYLGYLLGPVVAMFRPGLARSATLLRLSLLVLVASLAAMTLTVSGPAWLVLRLVAGAASSWIFVTTVDAGIWHLRAHGEHLAGWMLGGIGGGIALSGLLVGALDGWRAAWWSAAALGALLVVPAWFLPPAPREHSTRPTPSSTLNDSGTACDDDRAGPTLAHDDRAAPTPGRSAGPHRWFAALFVSYFLEGVGYIIAGTFLVAAINQSGPSWWGNGAWVLVGLAALPSSAMWGWLSHRYARPTLLCVALVIQAVGIALPAMFGAAIPALLAAVLFGATFQGVTGLAMSTGAHLGVPRAVAVLTAGYGVGQVLGPIVVAPLLTHGYRAALVVGAAVVLAAAVTSAGLRIRFPSPGAPAVPTR